MKTDFKQTRPVLTKTETNAFNLVKSFANVEGDYAARLARVFVNGATTEVARKRRLFAVKDAGIQLN